MKRDEKKYMELEIISNNGKDYLFVPDGFAFYPILDLENRVVLLQITDTFTDYPKKLEELLDEEQEDN